MRFGEIEGNFLRHRRDWFHFFSAVTAPVVFFWPYTFGIRNSTELVLYILFVVFWIVDLNYILHLHVHRPFTTSKFSNRLLDFSLGSVTGMTSANWRIQHVYGHHRGNDLAYTHRCFYWTMEHFSMRRALLYSFGNVPKTFISPIIESFQKGIISNVQEPLNYRCAFVEQMIFVSFVLMLAFYKPLLTAGFLVPWYFLVFAMTRYVDYLNHYGCTNEKLNFANNSLSRSFNWRIDNFGYHTAHHLDPGAHWTDLPAIHAAIADEIPTARLKTFDWSTILLPFHAWRERPYGPEGGLRKRHTK